MDDLNTILLPEDIYWKQKARMKWTEYGERNTHFFHTSVIDRRRKSKIFQLSDGSWCMDEGQLVEMARSFYQDIYSCGRPPVCMPWKWRFPKLKRNCAWWLNRPITVCEVWITMSQLSPHKAPGLDGLPACAPNTKNFGLWWETRWLSLWCIHIRGGTRGNEPIHHLSYTKARTPWENLPIPTHLF